MDKQAVYNRCNRVREEYIKDERTLLDIISQIFPFNEGFLEPAAYVLLWSGVLPKELLKIQDLQVDFGNRRVYDSFGEPITPRFSDETQKILQQYAGRKVFGTLHKDRKSKAFLKRMVPANSTLEGKPITTSALHVRFDKAGRRCEELLGFNFISPKNVWRSGRYVRLWELEQNGARLDKSLVLNTFRFELKDYREIMMIYAAWKEAFK